MTGRDLYADLMTTSTSISRACNLFKSVRHRVFRHVGWDYDMPLPSTATGVEVCLRVALSTTCRECHQGQLLVVEGVSSH